MSLTINLQKVYILDKNEDFVYKQILSPPNNFLDAKCRVYLSVKEEKIQNVEYIGSLFSKSFEIDETINETEKSLSKTKLVYKFQEDKDLTLGTSLEIICFKPKRFGSRFLFPYYSI